MNGLLLLSIGLTAIVGSLCIVLYTRLQKLSDIATLQSEQIGRMDVKIHELVDVQAYAARRLDQLATDVLQREIYQSADDRHHLAIQSAQQGFGLAELVRKHGLSSDEAALILALHGNPASDSFDTSKPTTCQATSADLERVV